MLRSRIIPCLLVQNNGLVKTLQFGNPKYVGDPINAVKIFNEKEVDELIVLDIDATTQKREPDYHLIKNLAAECRMPLCYGGGIKSVEQIERIIGLGVEKVALSSVVVSNSELVSEAAKQVGSQSVVVVLDVKKVGIFRRYELVTHNGKAKTGISPVDFAKKIEELGAGELVINSVDLDGTLEGYDLPLIKSIKEQVSIPVTVLGGAGSLQDITDLVREFKIIGAGAGSLFVFKGKYRAVLINYPNNKEKDAVISDY